VPLRNALRSLSLAGRLPEFLWRRLPAPAGFTVPVGPGEDASFRYTNGNGDLLARPLYWRGAVGAEPEMMGSFVAAITGARTLIDVGANTGVFSLAALAANDEIDVIAVEPLKRVANLLSENLELNAWQARAEVIIAAATAEDGVAEFVDPDRSVPTSARLTTAKYRVGADDQRTIEVQTVSLDSLLGERRVDVIKIDVEGAEDQVLNGARMLLERDGPIVFFECHQEGPVVELEGLFAEFGYSIAHLRGVGPVEVSRLSVDPNRRERNFVAVPNGQDFPETAHP